MEIDRLIHNIERFDHYFDSVNNKSALYIAINTFVTGGIIAIFNQKEFICNCHFTSYYSLGIALLLGVLSLIFLINTSIPYFSTKPDSLYYFGSISKIDKTLFFEKSISYTDEETLSDLRKQVYILSKGLTKKYRKLQVIGYLLILQFILLLPTIYLIIKT
jgi:hypothetical protein